MAQPGSETSTRGRSPGRPRDTARHDAVLAATREILVESGYPAVTFSDVAARAGVTRQLVYRWWPSRSDLVAEAIFTDPSADWPTEFPGSLEANLRAYIAAMVDYASRPAIRAGIIGLMSDGEAVPDLPGLRAGVLDPLADGLEAILHDAVEVGEAHAGVDVRLTMNTLRGAIVMHLIADYTPPEVIVEHLTQLCVWAFGTQVTRAG